MMNTGGGKPASIVIVFVLVVALGLSFALLRLITPHRTTGYDGSFYEATARELVSSNPKTATAPYCYRLLPAWILHFAPLPPETAFAVFNTVAYGLSAFLLFFLFGDFGFSPGESGLGVFFFVSSWITVRFSIFYPIHIDPAYYLILVLAFRALVRRNDRLFALSLFLAALTREYFFALIPAYYLRRQAPGRFWDPAAARKTIALSAGPVLAFFLLRLLIPKANIDFSYASHAAISTRMFFRYWPRMIYSYFNVYGVALFIILIQLPAALTCLWRNPYLLSYLLVSTAFLITGGVDRDRINFTAFPVVLVLALEAMRANRPVYRRRIMLLVMVAANLFLMRIFEPMGPENYRRIWWSDISFCPEAVLRARALQYLLMGTAVALVSFGLRLRLPPRK